jgi:leader peptidase (prepilin peptidase)/N-methyltransferase
LVIALGLVVGSFLNVCIARIPHDESVVLPASRCPACETPIAWHDNIPVLSYVVLRGRCRSCKARISPRYPFIEILTAVLAILLFEAGFPAQELVLYSALVAALVVVTFIDIDYRIIPDVITLPSILIAPAAAFIVGQITVVESLFGILVGGGVLWGIALLYQFIRKQEGMGLGDVKMLAMVGGFMGWEATLFTLVVGSLFGTIIGVVVMVSRRGRLDMEIPFGPFLAAGALLYLFGGPELIGWYLALPTLL